MIVIRMIARRTIPLRSEGNVRVAGLWQDQLSGWFEDPVELVRKRVGRNEKMERNL